MTPQEIAEVRPRLLDFAAEMLGGLPRKDQRAAGELYVRGLLTDGQRKSMQPMAARLGVDHQRGPMENRWRTCVNGVETPPCGVPIQR